MIYLCSPKLCSLQELEEHQMHPSDLSPHDTTRDLILLNQQWLEEIELSTQLERKKEELRVLAKQLAIEKKKTETLLYTTLPKHVASQLKEGKKMAAGKASPSLPRDLWAGGSVPLWLGAQNLKPERPGVEFWIHRFWATWPWANYLSCISSVFSSTLRIIKIIQGWNID